MQILDISVSGRKFPKVDKPTLYQARNIPDLDSATPERLLKSESTIDEDGVRAFQDELLIRMAGKGQLYPNATINLACKVAGEKYYEDWYGSNMGGLQAIDYGKVRGPQNGSTSHLPPGRIAAKCRADYRAARAAVPAKYRKPLELILLDGQSDLVAIGKAITGASSPNSNRAVAIERFTAGLYMLALHYVLLA